jgi:hypothetical protein
MNSWYSALFFIAALAAVVGMLILIDKSNRQTITQNIEASGGKVIEILKLWGEGSRSEQAYEVGYMTAHGERRKETCKVGNLSSDVTWVSRRPPGSGI